MQTPTTEAALAAIVQLDLAISARLLDDPQTLALFDAYNNLVDSLYTGLNGELLRTKLELVQAVLSDLGVMGKPLPKADAL
jgi:hypothetical protein